MLKLGASALQNKFRKGVLRIETRNVFLLHHSVASMQEWRHVLLAETFLTMLVQKSFNKITMLHTAMLAETCLATLFHLNFSLKFQRVTEA